MPPVQRLDRLAVLALVLACLSLPASAEEATWNQAAATSAAQAFAKDVADVQLAFRREPGEMMPTGDSRSRYQLKQDLRLLASESRHLASELEASKGRDETYPVFRRLEEIRRDAAEAAQRAMISQPTLEKIAAARENLGRLAAFYGEELPPPAVSLPAE